LKSLNKTLLAISPLLLSFAASPAHAASLKTVDNGLGVYDSALNATWTADANLLGTLEAANPNLIATIVHDEATAIFTAYGHTLTAAGDFGAGGLVSWWGAQAYVAYLNQIDYGNSSQWALPTTPDNNSSTGFNKTTSQLGELFYSELGGTAGNSFPSSTYFTNEQAYVYWSGTTYSASLGAAWLFDTYVGDQYGYNKGFRNYALAVSPGEVNAATVTDPSATVPEPGMLALMLTGFSLLGWMRRVQAG
jgi:hypothetical protein